MTGIKPEIGKIDQQPRTVWRSIYMASFMLIMSGMNISICNMSLWPYVKSLAPSTEVAQLGWIFGANSLGCLVANIIYGWWAQKYMKTAHPVAFGFTLATVGNFIYAILPLFPLSWVIPLILVARFLCGFAAGTLGVLRSFAATSSTVPDRLKAVAFASTGLTVGLSIGPVVQMLFMPIGAEYHYLLGLPINQYTSPGYAMTIVSALCVYLLVTLFEENHVGIISDDEKKSNPYLVLPKFDRTPIGILFVIWTVTMAVGATMSSLASPLTMTLFNWSAEESVTKNALLSTCCSLMAMATNVFNGTKIGGKIPRRVQIIIGQSAFMIFFAVNYPWFFYEGPLNYKENSTSIGGGCPLEMEWCSTYTRVPPILYYICYICALGYGFPMTVSPLNALFSIIVGPRKQSFLQGMMTFSGSFAQFVTPFIVTYLYEKSGFRYIAVSMLCLHLFGVSLLLLFYNRMVPLQRNPPIGVPTKYKKGTFYKM